MTITQAKRLLVRLKSLRTPFESIWSDIDRVYSPFTMNRDGAQKGVSPIIVNDELYDCTGSDAKRVQTEGLIGYLTNPASNWFSFRFEDEELDKNRDAKIWLDQCESFFIKAFPKSNFYNANSMLLDQGQHNGTAFLFPQADQTKGFNFKTFNVHDIWIDEDSKDNVDRFIIKIIMTTEKLVKEYDDVSKEITKELKNNPYQEWTVYFCVTPNDDYDKTKLNSFKYNTLHWVEELEEKKAILREGGYHSFPLVVWRMFKIPTMAWGYGTCLEALPEVEKINIVEKDLLEASNLAVRPTKAIPIEMEDEELDFSPNGMIYYSDPNRLPHNLSAGANYPIGKDTKLEYKRKIENIFKVDFYRMLQTLSERAMTATQVNEMANEKASTIGVMVSRLITEYLNPLFDRLLNIGFEQQLLPPLPSILEGMKAQDIKIDYSGVLAQMQRRFSSVVNHNQVLQSLSLLGQIDPGVYDNLDIDIMAREIVLNSDAKAKTIRSEDMVKKIREQRAMMQQQQVQMQQEQMRGDVYSKTSKTPEKGSGAEQMMEGAQ